MVLFEGGLVGLGLLLILSLRFDRVRARRGVVLGAAAGLGFGVSDVAIKTISGDLAGRLPWIVLALVAAVGSVFALARSLQVGEGVSVIAVTSIAANPSAIPRRRRRVRRPDGTRRPRGRHPRRGSCACSPAPR